MKNAIIGVGLLLSGVLGEGLLFLCAVLNGDGVGVSTVLESLGWLGLTVPFLFCLVLTALGLVLALTEAFRR